MVRKRSEIRVVEVSRLLDSYPSDSYLVPKLRLVREERIDLATRYRIVAAETTGKVDGKKVSPWTWTAPASGSPLTGVRLWQHHADGVYLSAESLAAKGLGQKVKVDLRDAF